MGATSQQGWYLFVFLAGFTLAPAGFVAVGWPLAVLGIALMVAALAGFHSIKEPVPRANGTAPGHVTAALGVGVRKAN